ncbi:Cyclic di-GMP phosphodiesterase response regulator RpfG [Fundidesulfovibrio magnetotacticus]|uniref:Cyclic di-GMP phosphodiesterase response regulator RpfG n=1 Tax=Fundidesulfovibrio magnetotacticus TaxID=2730080 RepID=A0A6V8LJ65_9BACT|nr:HD-GYP domain-containing protein [Fundidesulfovibrio magnetotacticus]GFK92782.1 Cyclic di-GMP phosphodiesterase response regulator RpfG [Fundidesulfovibrio magnetotacticus]
MLKEIPIDQLVPGMYVERAGEGTLRSPLESVRDWMHDTERIRALKDSGVRTVTVDTEKTLAPRPGSAQASAQSPDPAPVQTPGQHSGPAPEESRDSAPPPDAPAGKVYAHCLGHVMDVMRKVREGLEVDYSQSFAAVDTLLSGMATDPAQLLLLAKLHHHDEYTLRHSLNVSLLALLFGRHLGMEGEELRRLGFAGLYHDLGKFRIPLDILNKPGRLSEREFDVMRRHSVLGYELLRGQPGITTDILLGVLHHHERYDGQGYPRKLQGDEKDPFSRILTIVDIYDALTSDRVYKKAFTPHDSVKSMFAWRNESFHPGLLEKFVECFGVYPPGSFVRLSDQTYAVVVDSRPETPARPLVKVSHSRRLAPLRPELVDLARTPKDGPGGLAIEACLDPRSLNLAIDRLV